MWTLLNSSKYFLNFAAKASGLGMNNEEYSAHPREGLFAANLVCNEARLQRGSVRFFYFYIFLGFWGFGVTFNIWTDA